MADHQGHGGVLLDEQHRHTLFDDLSVAPLFHIGYVPRFRNSGNVEVRT